MPANAPMPTMYAPALAYADAATPTAPRRTVLRVVGGYLADTAAAAWIVARHLLGWIAPLVLMLAYATMIAGWIVWAATFALGRVLQWSVNYGPGVAGGFGRLSRLPLAAMRSRR